MNGIHIGCGGWSFADFGDSQSKQLENYSKLFNFVEVNTTFYQIPKLEQCKKWRQTVPDNFSFSVKCNRDLTHKYLLSPSNKAFKLFNKMIEICSILNSIALVIQTPIGFLNNPKNLKNSNDFFAKVEGPIKLVWEVKGYEKFPTLQPELIQIFSEYNITHCTDFSKNFPLFTTNLVYSRIFGLGKQNMWQFSDEEVKVLNDKIKSFKEKSTDVVISFHTMRMEKDAARQQEFTNKGVLIPVTESVGLNSIMSVVKEYNKFPISKDELLEAHGWKIIDLANNKRIRALKILDKIPDQKYSSFKSIKEQLENIVNQNKQKKLEEFN